MLTLTPVVCVLSSIAFSKTLETYLEQDESLDAEKEKKKKSPSHGDDDSDDDDDDVKSRSATFVRSFEAKLHQSAITKKMTITNYHRNWHRLSQVASIGVTNTVVDRQLSPSSKSSSLESFADSDDLTCI